MSEEILYKIKVENSKAISESGKLTKSIIDQKNVVKDLTKKVKEGGKDQDAWANKLAAAQRKLKGQSAALKDNNKTLERNSQISKKNTGSLVEMRAQLARNVKAYDGLTKKERDNVNVGGKLQTKIKGQSDDLKKLEGQTGRNQRSVGGYTKGMSEGIQQSGVFARELAVLTAIKKVLTGATGANTAATVAQAGATKKASLASMFFSKVLKILKMALISTGIGAILVVLGSLIAYFKSSEEGTRDLEKALAPLKVVIGNIKDAYINFGGAIVEAFKKPKETIDKLKGKFQTLKDFIKNTFLKSVSGNLDILVGGFKKMIAAINLTFQKAKNLIKDNADGIAKAEKQVADANKRIADGAKKLEEARETAGKAAQKIYDNIKKSAKGFIDEQKRETKILKDLEDRKYALLKRTRAVNEENAQIKIDIAKARVIANDKEHYTAEERFKAIKEWNKLIDTQENNKLGIKKEAYALQIAENKLATSGGEDLEAAHAKKMEMLAATQEAQQQKLRMITKLGEAEREVNKKKQEEANYWKEIDDAENEALLLELEQSDAEAEADLEKLRTKYKKEQEIKRKAHEADIARNKAEIKMSVIAGGRMAQDVDDLKSFADASLNILRDVVKRKIMAKVSEAVATQLAKVFSTVPFPFNIIAAPIAGLAVSALFNKAIPKFAEGTVLSGNSHAQGGIQLYGKGGQHYGEAENNEMILTKGVFENPTLRQKASDLNMLGGGKPLVNSPSRPIMASGGVLSERNTSMTDIARLMDNKIANIIVRNDINEVTTKQNEIQIQNERASF
jgi:hypothetical protein